MFGARFAIVTMKDGTDEEKTKELIESYHPDLKVTEIGYDKLLNDLGELVHEVAVFYLEFQNHFFLPIQLIVDMNLKRNPDDSAFVYWAVED